MKLKQPTIFLLLFIILFVSCNAKKRIAQTDRVEEKTIVESKHDERTTERKESTINITDTSKKSEQKIEIVEIRRTEKDSSSEVTTNYKKTTLYLSDEDKFLFKNGYLKDSTEVKRADDLDLYKVQNNKTEIKEKKQVNDRIIKTIAVCLLSFIVFFVIGTILYKKIRNKIKR